MARTKQAAREKKPRSRKAAAVEALFLLLLLAAACLLLRGGYQRYMRTAYPLRYVDLVETYAGEYGVEPSLVYAIIRTESGFDPEAVSSAGARGLMQLTEDTLDWAVSKSPDKEELTAEDLFDPAVNIRYGVYVLKLLGEQWKVKETVLAAYNAGQGNVRKWLADERYSPDGETLDNIPFSETRAYVEKVRKAQEMYRELYGLT